MRIAIIGAFGQLGTDLQDALTGDVVPLGHGDVEITDAASVQNTLTRTAPDLVVNAAAYNKVDQAEAEPDAAFAANALGPRHLAQYCAGANIPLLHVSTDYVFSGDLLEPPSNRPYVETDAPVPASAYGVSKFAGEQFVRAICPRHFVVRTCGLYGHRRQAGAANFVETMLRLGRERPELKVVSDQTCTPTSTKDLAAAIAALVRTSHYGLYHATNSGQVTWHEFATAILRRAGIATPVRAITSAEFGAKARRPAYSVLDNRKLRAAIGFELRPWEDALAEYLATRG